MHHADPTTVEEDTVSWQDAARTRAVLDTELSYFPINVPVLNCTNIGREDDFDSKFTKRWRRKGE